MEIKEIKVEVPEGCTVKYKSATKTIKIVPEDYIVIKDFETACRVLGISNAIPDDIQTNEQLCAMYKMQIVLKAVNKDHTFNLINGKEGLNHAFRMAKATAEVLNLKEEQCLKRKT